MYINDLTHVERRSYKCVIKECNMIYTDYQCKNCPDQLFDPTINSNTTATGI